VRKLCAFIVQTVDGYYEGPNGEFDWPNVDDEFNEFAIEQIDALDLLVFGRRTYEGMAAYWPSTDAVRDDPAVAERMNAKEKVVFSTTLERAEWNNTRLVRDDLAEEVRKLKDQPGRYIGVFGSIELTKNLVELGLVDELRIMIHPILLGAGHSLLHGLETRVALKLVDSRIFASSNVMLIYAPAASA
jgi:dihydrofolate reductase